MRINYVSVDQEMGGEFGQRDASASKSINGGVENDDVLHEVLP